ncbi:MAG: metallophosphoesterase [Candidatus Pacearchaeota archaeon]|jgi:putative SbcD/Mre11-related phosphoesterase
MAQLQSRYELIDKCLFFPKEGILVIGDLHIGYEEALIESGILVPEQQVKEVIEDLKKIIKKIEESSWKIKKVIFIGDVKHMFSWEYAEKKNFNKILEFLHEYVNEKDIIIIKGNHDTSQLGLPLKNYYIEGDLAFLHGHISYPEVFDKKINIVVSGHRHPSVTLAEKPGVKKEDYKCFLVGKIKGKTFIVVPSFVGFYEGTPVNEYKESHLDSFSIIPRKDILKFKVYVIGDDKVYEFGRVGKL